MFNQQFSRNQRAKGLKLRHVLQICVLVAICIWLIFQIKDAHDKKKVLEEQNSEVSRNAGNSQTQIFNLGRKDLWQIVQADSVNQNHNVEEENGEGKEGTKENKPEMTENGEEEGARDVVLDNDAQGRAVEEVEVEFPEQEDKDVIPKELMSFDTKDQEVSSEETQEESFTSNDGTGIASEGTQKVEPEFVDPKNSDEVQVEITEQKDLQPENVASKIADDGSNGSIDISVNVSVNDSNYSDSSVENQAMSSENSSASAELLDSSVDESFNDSNNSDSSGALGEKQAMSSENSSVSTEQLDLMERKDIEAENSVTGTTDSGSKNGSVGSVLIDDSKADDSSNLQKKSESAPNENGALNGNADEKSESSLGASQMGDELQPNATATEVDNQTEAQADQISFVVESNNKGESQTDLIAADMSEFHNERPNSTTIADTDQPSDKETIGLDSSQQNVTPATNSDDSSNPKNVILEQTKPNTIIELEESKHSSDALTTDKNADSLQGESTNLNTEATKEEEHDNSDISASLNIQNEVKDGQGSATE